MENTKKLFLLDAYALIFRAYYAFINRPITDKEGNNTSAVFGFVNTLDEILRNENPSHIAVAFDPPSPTFRHDMYPEYKANRQTTPEDIKRSVPFIKKIIEAYNIQIIEVIGYEADDAIGTLAKKAGNEGYEVYMMTPDKDYAQLVDENIYMYKPGRSGGDKEILGIEEVKEKFSVDSPKQVIDLLALWGDSSDNVPGAPGIGEKTAKKLLAQFQSVENLLDSTDQLKGKQKQNLEKFKEQIELSKVLVTIDTNVPVKEKIEDFERKSPNKEQLGELFDQLDFRTLKKRILGEAAPREPVQTSLFGDPEIPSKENTSNLPEIRSFNPEYADYQLIESESEIDHLVTEIKLTGRFCFDTETSGLNPFSDSLIGIAFSYSDNKACYLPISSDEDANRVVFLLQPLWSDSGLLKIGHNLKFDMHFLSKYGARFEGPYFDTMIAHYLLKPDSRHKLDDVIYEQLNYKMIPIEELIGKKGKNQLSMKNLSPDRVRDYACEDADLTFQLAQVLKPKLSENQLDKLSETLEMPLMEVLFHMEQAGFKLDTKALKVFNTRLLDEINAAQKEIFSLAGEEFNIASPKQLGVVLFEKLKVTDKVRMTKTKQYSTGEEVLQKLVDKHPIIKHILEYRSLTKLQSTYVSALPQLIEESTGKIHTSFNQTIAATGRLSSVNPNLQNIPIREERGREIRKSFIPSAEDYILLAADYSQIELRLMAHLSQDEHMINAFNQGADIHRSTAAKVFKVEEEDVSREMRSQAKTANFGIIYGISAFGLAERLQISRSDAKSLIDSYFETFPKVKHYMDQCIADAKEKGYVTTMFGRKRFLPDIQSANATVRGFAERNAINSPLQGSAADIIKIAMINVQKKLEGKFKTKMILQVHDELVFDVYKPELESVKELVKIEMEAAASISVPLTVDMGTGDNWLEAH
jgi:DNA polymerase-1